MRFAGGHKAGTTCTEGGLLAALVMEMLGLEPSGLCSADVLASAQREGGDPEDEQ